MKGLDERLLKQLRIFLEQAAQKNVTETTTAKEVNAMSTLFPVYRQAGQYKVGDIRTDPDTRQPFRCILAYDADVQPDWNLSTPTLWIPYHGTDLDSAYPWKAPTGAHDMYKVGEYMTFTDAKIYKCLSDTNYSPSDYAQAWDVQNED